MLRAGGYILEASPAYRAAVARQQAKERERAKTAPELPKRLVWAPVAPKRQDVSQLIKGIIEDVAAEHGTTFLDIWSESKVRTITTARRAAIAKVHAAYPDMTLQELGRHFNRDREMVRKALYKAGVHHTRRYIDRAEVLRLISLDMTPQQIAEQMGFSVVTVLKASFQLRNKQLTQEKLESLERAIKLRAKGFSYAKIGKILGINGDRLQRDFVKAGLS